MFSFLSSLEFASPAMLFTALASPLLVLAYLRRQRRKKIVVSSVLLLKQLSVKRRIQRRFHPPLRFFLELLALLLLAAAAAGPSHITPDTGTAILIDTSLSMQARKSRAGSKVQQIDIARDSLKTWLAGQSASTEYSLYTSAPKLTQIGTDSLSRAGISEQLDNVNASWGTDSFENSILELASSGQYSRVIGFSDRPLAVSSILDDTNASESDKTRIQIVEVGAPQENLYIAKLQLDQEANNRGVARAEIGFSGQTPISVTAIFSAVGKNGVIQQGQQAKKITLRPNVRTELEFSVPSKARRHAMYQLELSTNSLSSRRNSLLADDKAWLSTSSQSDTEILLISGEKGKLQGLDSIPGLGIQQMTPAQAADLSPSNLNRFSLLLYHRSSPSFVPPVPTLLVLPPESNPLFPAHTSPVKPRVTSWSSTSPITRYLKVPLLEPGNALYFDLPVWGQAIVSTERGPLIAAGETGGVRIAASGMELLPFEGGSTPVLSILTLNVIQWLQGESNLLSGFKTGAALRLESGKSWIIRKPNGEIENFDVDTNETTFYQFEIPGPYVVSSVLPGTRKVEQAKTTTFAVNAFHPEESLTASPALLALPSTVARESSFASPRKPIWNWIFAIALLLITFELVHNIVSRPQQMPEVA